MHVEVALLYSKPVREWILMHRAQRGEIAIEGVPGPGMMLMAERTTLARYPARPRGHRSSSRARPRSARRSSGPQRRRVDPLPHSPLGSNKTRRTATSLVAWPIGGTLLCLDLSSGPSSTYCL
ncbi:hypothetical protein GCM10009853_072770 [Glycomyces scopariae]